MTTWTITSATRLLAFGIACMLIGTPAVGTAQPASERQQPAGRTDRGVFTFAADVGAPALPGSTAYDPDHRAYMLRASGSNMWGARDEFHAVWRPLRGDFVLRTHARFTSDGEPHRKLGWIVRTSLDEDAAYADAVVSGNGMTSLQYRRTAGEQTELIELPARSPEVIQLERRGRTFIMSVGRAGEPFSHTQVLDLDLGDAVYVGLFLCAHDAGAIATATFDAVSINVASSPGSAPERLE